MPAQIRGADIIARTLDAAGLTTIFTLSGNHIMPLFDAAIGTRLRLIHVRHEAAAVHMADAGARLTGQCGIVWVSGGAGFTNAAAALCTAQAGEAPLVLLSGHAGIKEVGRGAFQELRQAEMAEPVTKASWVVRSAATLGIELAEAVRIARSGRPGPVHLSLPFDLLEERVGTGPRSGLPRSRLRRRPKLSMRPLPLPSKRFLVTRNARWYLPVRNCVMGANLVICGNWRISWAFRSCRWKVRAASTIRVWAPLPRFCDKPT